MAEKTISYEDALYLKLFFDKAACLFRTEFMDSCKKDMFEIAYKIVNNTFNQE